MKTNLLCVITLAFVTLKLNAQLEFLNHTIIDKTFSQDNPKQVYSVDIDNDGDLDVVIASSLDKQVAWYENLDGLGNFGRQQIIPSGRPDDYSTIFDSASIYPADFDGDGDIDIVSNCRELAWYENIDSLGTFETGHFIDDINSSTETVFASDIDGDGDIDILSSSASGDKISWYENTNGLGLFGGEQIISTNVDNPNKIFVADADGDGDMDVFATAASDNELCWFENLDGEGSFGSKLVITSSIFYPQVLFVTDMDEDGDMDVISADGQTSLNNKLRWYENLDGTGNFNTNYNLIGSSPFRVTDIFVTDMDGDLDMDVICSNTKGEILNYKNLDGLGTFDSRKTISDTSGRANGLFAGDINGDGLNDAIAASSWQASTSPAQNEVSWFKNQEDIDEYWNEKVIVEIDGKPKSAFSADFDGDGDLDIISCDTDKISLFRNSDGLGNFNKQEFISLTKFDVQYAIPADMDNDGDFDVLACETKSQQGRVFWCENLDGLGNFGTPIVISDNVPGHLRAFADDIDNDGDLDVITASLVLDKVVWFENLDGQGTFGSEELITNSENHPYGLQVGDIDNDGDPDVIAYIDNSSYSWFENLDGQGTFGEAQLILSNDQFAYLTYLQDLDNDSDLDLVLLAKINGTIKTVWLENLDGLGTFGEPQVISVHNNGEGAPTLYVADLDTDGDLDIVIEEGSGTYSNTREFKWFQNIDSQGTFIEKPVIFFDEEPAIFMSTGDINGDDFPDIISTGGSMKGIRWHENLGTQFNIIQGTVTENIGDDNCNNENPPLAGLMITTDYGTGTSSTFSANDGTYQTYAGAGAYVTSITQLPAYYISNPSSYSSNYTNSNNYVNDADFCVEATASINDLEVSIYPSENDPRSGFNTSYRIVYKNVGTSTLSGSINFEFDNSKLQYLEASETVSLETGNSLTFDFEDLSPFEYESNYIDLEFYTFPIPTTSIGDTLISTATISPFSSDQTEENNTFNLHQDIVAAYDPNDITCLEGEQILLEQADEYLHYLIRFQNTGTASAINVRVEQALDNKLDWTTMQLESLSHNGRVEITNGNELKFIFDFIYLPDSTNDEPNSHGFIAYKIKPVEGVAIGDIFSATANIYFDFNPAIVTNTATTEIIETLSTSEKHISKFMIHPNPTTGVVNIKANTPIKTVQLYNHLGQLVLSVENSDSLNLSELNSGLYFMEIHDTNGHKETKKIIKD